MKKLVWFHNGLLSNHNRFLNKPQQYYAPHLKWQHAITSVVDMAVCLIDSTGTSKRFGDELNTTTIKPKYITNFIDGGYVDEHFDEVASYRVKEMYDQADANGYNEIRIAWSGGIDSTFALAAIMQQRHYGYTFTVLTTTYAKRENPLVWSWLMNSGVNVQFMDYNALGKDNGNYMLVTGDGDPYGIMFTSLFKNYTDDIFGTDWLKLESLFLDKDPTGLSWDYFKELMSLSHIPIMNCHQAWHWFEQCTDQDFLYRMAAYSDNTIIDADRFIPGKKLFWFLSSQDFANHGLYTTIADTPTDRKQIKTRMREYISKWMNLNHTITFEKHSSQLVIPKSIHKWRIYDDLSWDRGTNLLDCI
jgi:hypothetical protein